MGSSSSPAMPSGGFWFVSSSLDVASALVLMEHPREDPKMRFVGLYLLAFGMGLLCTTSGFAFRVSGFIVGAGFSGPLLLTGGGGASFLRWGGGRRSFSGLDEPWVCRGIGSCGIVHAVEPLVGAEEERSLASLSASAAAATGAVRGGSEEMTLVDLLVVFTSFGVFNVIWGCTAVLF